MPWAAFLILYAQLYGRPGLILMSFMISFNRKYVAASRDTKTKKRLGIFNKQFFYQYIYHDSDLKLEWLISFSFFFFLDSWQVFIEAVFWRSS